MKALVRAIFEVLSRPAVATLVTIFLELAILFFAAWAFLHCGRNQKGV